jgi:hypothetical protein
MQQLWEQCENVFFYILFVIVLSIAIHNSIGVMLADHQYDYELIEILASST